MPVGVDGIAYDRPEGLRPLIPKTPHLPAEDLFTVPLCIFLMLSACAFNPAPVSGRPQPPSQRITHHIVAPDDTLFAIAWRYEKDLVALARSNGLSHPYRIIAGQRLNLDTSAPVSLNHTPPKKLVKKSSGSERPISEHGANVGVAAKATTRNVTSGPKQSSGRKPQSFYGKVPVGPVTWQWPVKGSVSRHYDTNKVFKGINIQSLPGRAVSAAADGVVVYAGSGLRGYGNLVIIKHSDIYLSAYAHNRMLSVREGDGVKAGAKISTIGGDVNNRGRLYFELRKNGRPVDPMRLLPRQ